MSELGLYECRDCGLRWQAEKPLRREECPTCRGRAISMILVPRKSDAAPCARGRIEGTTRFNRRFVPGTERGTQ